MAHVQFQQGASDYRTLRRQYEVTQARGHYYATEPEEEAENERTFRQLDRISDGMGVLWDRLYAGQQATVERAGQMVRSA